MELSQGQIIQKPKMQDLSFSLMAHHLNVMHAPEKLHEYVPYGLGVMAQTRLTIWNMELSQGDIIQKAKMQELSSLFMTHRLNVMCTPVKFHEYISHGLAVGSYGPDTVNYMELSQGDIIQKAKMQELLSLFMTHRLNVMHASVKFHVYIPYGYGVIARTRLTIWNLIKGK